MAAGYLWIVVAWMVFEPAVPDRAEAEGVVASLYRGGDLLSVIGVGAVLSFSAYLLGSLSSSTLTPLLRRFFPKALPGSPDAVDQETNIPRSPLSPQARAALSQIVRASQDQVTSSLALTDLDLDVFLAKQTETSLLGVGLAPRRRVPSQPSKIRFPKEAVGPGSAQPVDVDARRAAALARAVLQDLDVVAKTRLLGRDQELYAEVDRNRAEVELRLAIIPPLLILAIAVGVRSDPWVLAVLAPLGAVLAWGLLTDAVRSERVANQILLQSIADRRVHSPTLERLEAEAAAQASRGQPELLRAAAQDAVVALQSAVDSLEAVGASEPSLAGHARQRIDLAQEPMSRVGQLFPRPVAQPAEEALRLMTELADAWVAVNEGHGAPADDPQERLKGARELLTDFQAQARDAVQKATALASLSAEPDRPEPAA